MCVTLYCNSSTGDDIYRQIYSTVHFEQTINAGLHSTPSRSPPPPPPSLWLFIHLSCFLSPPIPSVLFLPLHPLQSCRLSPLIHPYVRRSSLALTPLLFLLLLHPLPPLRACLSLSPSLTLITHFLSLGHYSSYQLKVYGRECIRMYSIALIALYNHDLPLKIKAKLE